MPPRLAQRLFGGGLSRPDRDPRPLLKRSLIRAEKRGQEERILGNLLRSRKIKSQNVTDLQRAGGGVSHIHLGNVWRQKYPPPTHPTEPRPLFKIQSVFVYSGLTGCLRALSFYDAVTLLLSLYVPHAILQPLGRPLV